MDEIPVSALLFASVFIIALIMGALMWLLNKLGLISDEEPPEDSSDPNQDH